MTNSGSVSPAAPAATAAVRRDAELANALGPLGNAAEGLGDQLARLHSCGRQGLHRARVGAFKGLHHRSNPMRLGLSQCPAVACLFLHQVAAPAFQRHVGGHLLFTQVVLLAHHHRLGFHLRLADLALLLLHGNLGVQFVLADGAIVLDGRHAAHRHRVVRRLQVRFPRLGLQRARHVGRGLHGDDGHAQHLHAQGLDLRLRRQLLLRAAGDQGRRAQRLLQFQRLHRLLHDHLHLHGHPVAQALGVFRRMRLPVTRQREVHQRRQPAWVGDAEGHLPLHRHALEIRRRQAQDEGTVLAGQGHGHQGAGGRVVAERLSGSLAHDAAAPELHQVHGGPGLDEADAEHHSSL